MGHLKLYSLALLLATFSPGVADCPSTTGTGDLHVHESGGGSFDFKGSCNTWFNMFQVQGLSLNAFFSCSTFGLAPEDPRSKGVLAVVGSHITKVAFTIKTTINAKNALLQVIYDENLQPRVFGTVDGGEMLDMVITKDLGPMKTDDLTIQMSDSSFSVANSKWKFVITPGTFRLVSGERRIRFDMAFVALEDPRDSACAAHGVAGQGFDGLFIEGKKDDYVPGTDGIFVTSAQGEGSIQGKFKDYIVGGPFETNFLYGRFDELMAPPRDTTLLNVFPGSGGNGKLSMEGKTAAAGVDRRLDDCEASTVAPTKAPTVAPTKAPTVAPTKAPVSACAASLNLKIDDITAAKGNATLMECVSEWDTKNVFSFDSLFESDATFNGNLEAWDTSSTTTMENMFNTAFEFNGNLNKWDTSKTAVMSNMFYMYNGNSDPNSFNGKIEAWDTSNTTTMYQMFYGADEFNGNLNGWDTSSVLTFYVCFEEATRFNGNLNSWDTSKVSNMEYMFYGASNFNGNLNSWDTSRTKTMAKTFYGATEFNGNLEAWDVSSATSVLSIFSGATGFNGNLYGWDIAKVSDQGKFNAFKDSGINETMKPDGW